MIEKLMTIILTFVSLNPRHPLYKNEAAAQAVAEDCNEAAEAFGQDPVELLTWAFYESSLIPTKVGKLGEVGLMQAHGVAARLCRRVDLDPGSVMCGAYLWQRGEIQCGSHYRALLWYASGKCEGTPRAKRIVEFRLRKVLKFKAQNP